MTRSCGGVHTLMGHAVLRVQDNPSPPAASAAAPFHSAVECGIDDTRLAAPPYAGLMATCDSLGKLFRRRQWPSSCERHRTKSSASAGETTRPATPSGWHAVTRTCHDYSYSATAPLQSNEHPQALGAPWARRQRAAGTRWSAACHRRCSLSPDLASPAPRSTARVSQ